jgi:phosphatidylglycerophosphatase A
MILRPDARFLVQSPAHFVALGFGTGLAPIAPGTVGTLLAFPVFFAFEAALGPFDGWPSRLAFLAVLACFFAIGVWACGRTGRDLGVADHGCMNWDEVVAFLLVLMLTPEGVVWQAVAFFLFRFFDVVKPPPIRHFDRTLKGGFGVMFDDLLAAFYALLVMAAARQLWPLVFPWQ